MKLANEAGLVADLERGLGEVHWMAVGYDPSLRLRLPVCGLTGLALKNAMNDADVAATAVESVPQLWADPDMKHVMVQAEIAGKTVLIDPTYSQFLDMTGLSPGYVIFGGEHLFPEQKIAVIDIEDGSAIARSLARSTMFFRMNRRPIDELEYTSYVFDELTYDELVEEWEAIWNPDNFRPFKGDGPAMDQAAERLASFILPEHVRLID